MIEEQATVKEIDKNSVIVQTTKQSSCGGCQQKDSCSTSVLDKYFGNKQINMKLSTDLNLSVGDTVTVGLDEAIFLRLTLLIYLLPLCVLILFAVLGQQLSDHYLIGGEALTISFGLVGFIACFYGLKYLIRQRLDPKRFNPILLNKA